MFKTHFLACRPLIATILSFCFALAATVNTHAYDVEADSVNNTVYILLRNLNEGDSYDSISVNNTAPDIVSSATANIIPASVNASGSDIVSLDFTVATGAYLGASGDLEITVSGSVAGQTVEVMTTVPLTVVANVAAAQGYVGTGLPAPYAGGVDTDGDGVSDALETAFGSNPNSADSQPGDLIEIIEENIPMLGLLGMIVMGVLFVGFGSTAARRNASVFLVMAVTLLPMDLSAGSATRIHLIADIPVPPPMPELLSGSSFTASSQLTPAARAFDGNIVTRWESTHRVDPQSLTIDLGATYSLSEVIIKWEAANAASYRIDGSLDGSTWTNSVASFSGGIWDPGTGVRRTDTLAVSGSYRYVRMYGQTRPTGNVYGYSIWEMEVYGFALVDSDNDGVADSMDQCPNTATGISIDEVGCAIPDSDGDGVPDSADSCPNTTAGAFVDAAGCVIVIYVNEVASINNILAGGGGASQPGLTLYVFDNDPSDGSASNCNGGCATNWPPVLVTDGVASGVADLGIVERADGSEQATYNGRPLYYFINDSVVGDTNGDGAGGVWHTVAYAQTYANLFDSTTALEPDTQFETAEALVTRWSDRPRTRHSREDEFQSYDHYVKFYFEDRSSNIEIIDYVAKGGDTIEMNVRTIFPLSTTQAENRWWFASPNATYMSNTIMEFKGFDGTYYHYQKTGNHNPRTNSDIAVGDRLEIEISQFSAAGIPRGQANYYGTVFLYIVGEGIVPWYAKTGNEDSEKIPEEYLLGGATSMHYQYSDEPNDHFLQMATNLGYENGQTFLLGRRVHHSSFVNGMHDEDPANGVLTSNAGLAGTRYINERCSDCHERNGGAPVADNGELLDRWVFKVGDANGEADPNRGHVLQPNGSAGEGSVSIASWTELSNGLRKPNYQFTGGTPAKFSARIAPRLVGLGLLEAIVESDIEALADPGDSNGDGISGRISIVSDAITGQNRIGRFGWKAAQPTVKHQAAAALSTDLGVRTSVMPNPDCGSAQTNCGDNSPLMPDENLDNLTLYLSALGVRPQRVWKQGVEDQQVLQGRELFRNHGCVDCHTETFQTSEYHPLAEVRNQTIHPYSDMLLHDMGAGLADTLGEGVASGSEWRTTPLWGLGLAPCVTGGVVNPSGREGGESCSPHEAYLHDGRARTLDEAIMWHGGEGATSRAAYDALSTADKALMIHFLKSL